MALKAGYVGVKRWLYEKLQATTAKNVKDIADIWANNSLSGVKNYVPPYLNTGTFLDVVFTNNNGILNLNGTANATNSVALTSRTPSGNYFYLPIGKYKYKADPMTTVEIGTTYNGSYKKIASSSSGVVEFEITSNSQSDYKLDDGSVLTALYIGLVNTTVYNNVKVKPMIYPAADPDPTFAPYAMTNQELTKAVYFKGVLSTGADLNDIKEAGIYSFTTTPTNAPSGVDNAVLIVTPVTTGNVNQTIIKTASAKSEIYSREYGGSPASWFGWYKYTGTAVTQAKAPTDDPELSVEEPETVTKTTRKTTKKEDN